MFDDTLVWRNGEIRLRLQGFLTRDSPPERFVLAGRAIVLRGGEVLVVTTPDGHHIIPGGRRDPGELTVNAVRRELLEETGWLVGNLRPFAVLHLHYETDRPTDLTRIMYPDFLWHVFTATPLEFRASERLQDEEPVLDATFIPIKDALNLNLASYQRQLLDALARGSIEMAT
jgi:8-oxo-dGTP pyrophosphatase MutT (NUDIX family)